MQDRVVNNRNAGLPGDFVIHYQYLSSLSIENVLGHFSRDACLDDRMIQQEELKKF